MYTLAIVTEVDPATCTARVRIPEADNMVSPFLRIIIPTSRATKRFYLPSVDEQVAVLMRDDGTEGVILGAVYSQRDTTHSDINTEGVSGVVFEDGTRVIMDANSSTLTVDSRSDVIVTADRDCTVTATREASLNSSQTIVKTTPTGVTVSKGALSLKTELSNILTALQAETHPTLVGPSGPPVNVAAYIAAAANIALLFEA